MSYRYSLQHLQAKAKINPEGREAQLLSKGTIENDMVFVDAYTYYEIMQVCTTIPIRRFNINELKASAKVRPVGYVDFILTHGKINGDFVILFDAPLAEFNEKFTQTDHHQTPPIPTLAGLAHNFTAAMSAWSKAGFEIVEREEYERRHATCLTCEFWQPDAMLGIGKCRKCGCSKIKLWLKGVKCPDKPARW